MSGHSVVRVPVVPGILDHQAGVVGNLKPLHPPNELSSVGDKFKTRKREKNDKLFTRSILDFTTYVFPENMGPRISWGGRGRVALTLIAPTRAHRVAHLNVAPCDGRDTRACSHARHSPTKQLNKRDRVTSFGKRPHRLWSGCALCIPAPF